MGKYREALAEMPVDPDVTTTRSYRNKYGFGLSFEKEITDNLGFFLRAGWNDGQTETWAFTEIDETAAVGLLLKGKAWGRPADQVGLAGVVNGLSDAHKDYLAAGGIGFIIGDGRLSYAPEEILETYYNWQAMKGINVTLDFQGVEQSRLQRGPRPGPHRRPAGASRVLTVGRAASARRPDLVQHLLELRGRLRTQRAKAPSYFSPSPSLNPWQTACRSRAIASAAYFPATS